MIDSESGQSFRKVVIININEKNIKLLTNEELINHGYNNLNDMLESHKKYYGDKINLDTIVKIVTFKLND